MDLAQHKCYRLVGTLLAHRSPVGRHFVWHHRARMHAGTILLAEDHADSRDALSTLLAAFGYRVLLAGNGREAVVMGMEHQPDLVLMDMMMPGMDGLAATRALRTNPGFRQVPIIAITAMEGADGPALDAGCNAILRKPVTNARALVATIQSWLGADQHAA